MPSGDSERDTIAALATPSGRGGIGVVRVSGPAAPDIGVKVAGALPEPRHAALRVFCDRAGQRIDEGITLYFPAPNSYTGEPTLELQGHGGPIVMQMLLEACLDAGARLAEPGEFTRRAFLDGRLDLAQAEAVADLIDAASREAARSAQRSLSGEFSAAVAAVAREVLELRALIEAMLDFPEDEIDTVHRDDAANRLARAQSALQEILKRSRQGSLLRQGIHVVIAGAPNVGKSSLLNRLAGEERAIVTPIAGTTRDALREAIDLEGVPIVMVDTAGLRTAIDEVERIGIERARGELARADVVIQVFDAADPLSVLDDRAVQVPRVDVYNKSDLVPGWTAPAPAITLSAKTGAGLADLRKAILAAAGWSSTGESVFLARERHVRALARAGTHLGDAARQVGRAELFAEELRLAHTALGEITGEFHADDLLGEIFQRFCIGK